MDLTLQEDMPSWVKGKGRKPGLGFDSMREGACQSQRRKREAGLKFDSMRGRVFLGQRKGQEARIDI